MMKKGSLFFIGVLMSLQVMALEVGQKAPLFKLPRLDASASLELKNYRGKVVYLDFWASWCGPCRKSLPLLNELRAELKGQGFEVIAINLDENPELGKKFLQERPVDYPIGSDTKGVLPQAYGVMAMPTSYLIDRKGVVRKVHEGFRESDMPKIRKEVMELLSK